MKNRKCILKNCHAHGGTSGLCKEHWRKMYYLKKLKPISKGTDFSRGICNIKNCQKAVYSQNLCRSHYERKRRTGFAEKIKKPNCIYCNRPARRHGEYKNIACWTCSIKKLQNRNPLIDYRVGINNVHWNNGSSQYPKQGLMKHNRKLLLSENPRCQICKKRKATEVHHVDFSKTNHAKENLMPVCRKCHISILHKNRPNTKFRILYGKSALEISKEINLTVAQVYYFHKIKTLNNYLKNPPLLR